jgi:NitT/TauT family transport system substrate-binding protein
VAKFVRASVKGWKDYLNDPGPAYATIAKLNPALNPELMHFSWQQLRGDLVGQMEADPRTTVYSQLVDTKVIGKQFDPAVT